MLGAQLWMPSSNWVARAPSHTGAEALASDVPNGVHFALAEGGRVSLVVLNVTGAVIRRLLEHDLPQGEYTIYWDGKDDRGRPQTSGIYHVRLGIGGRASTRQLLLLK